MIYECFFASVGYICSIMHIFNPLASNQLLRTLACDLVPWSGFRWHTKSKKKTTKSFYWDQWYHLFNFFLLRIHQNMVYFENEIVSSSHKAFKFYYAQPVKTSSSQARKTHKLPLYSSVPGAGCPWLTLLQKELPRASCCPFFFFYFSSANPICIQGTWRSQYWVLNYFLNLIDWKLNIV